MTINTVVACIHVLNYEPVIMEDKIVTDKN